MVVVGLPTPPPPPMGDTLPRHMPCTSNNLTIVSKLGAEEAVNLLGLKLMSYHSDFGQAIPKFQNCLDIPGID